MYKSCKVILSILLTSSLVACVVLPKRKYHAILEDSKSQSETIVRLEAENAALKARIKQAATDIRNLSGLWLGKTELSRKYPKKVEK